MVHANLMNGFIDIHELSNVIKERIKIKKLKQNKRSFIFKKQTSLARFSFLFNFFCYKNLSSNN